MESVLEIGLSILSTSATGVIGYLVYRLRKHEESKEREEEQRRHEEAAQEQRRQEEYDALRQGVLALNRDRILQGYRYYKRNGGISTQDLETMEKLYAAYHALGGNGTITALYEKIIDLPLREE